MSKIIFREDSIRIQFEDDNAGNFNETSYVDTTVSEDGVNITIVNATDPNTIDIELVYADIVSPTTGSITDLVDLIKFEILKHTNKVITLEESTDIMPASYLALQNVGDDLYWNGSMVSTGAPASEWTETVVQVGDCTGLNVNFELLPALPLGQYYVIESIRLESDNSVAFVFGSPTDIIIQYSAQYVDISSALLTYAGQMATYVNGFDTRLSYENMIYLDNPSPVEIGFNPSNAPISGNNYMVAIIRYKIANFFENVI